MKKLLLIAMAMAFAGGVYAQEQPGEQPEDRRGYIGISLGPAFPTGDIDGSKVSGAQLCLVNFGYRCSDHVGIAVKWFGNAFVSNWNSNVSIGLGGIALGPLFSVANKNEAVEFDLIPMIGLGAGVQQVSHLSQTSKTTVVFGVGTAVRWNCGRRISVSAGLDLLSASPESVNLSAVGIMFGVNYRLK